MLFLLVAGTDGVCAVVTLSSSDAVASATSYLQGTVFPNTTWKISFVPYDAAFHQTLKDASAYSGEAQSTAAQAALSEKMAHLKTLKVAELREELGKRGLDTKGLKAALLKRLQNVVKKEEAAINNLPPPKIEEPSLPPAAVKKEEPEPHALMEEDRLPQDHQAASVPTQAEGSLPCQTTLRCAAQTMSAITGPKDRTKKSIERNTLTRVDVSQEGDHCVITIRAPDQTSLHDAEDILKGIIKDHEEGNGERKGAEVQPKIEAPANPDAMAMQWQDPHTQRTEEVITCAQSIVRFIIGKGGSVIKNIEADSGARVKVDQDRSGGVCHVYISGMRDSVERAYKIVSEIIEDNESWDMEDYRETIRCSRECGMRVVGRRGANIDEIQRDSGAKVDMLWDNRSNSCDVCIRGSRERVNHACDLVRRIVRDFERQGGGPQGGGPADERQIMCPRSAVASVVGPMGSVVKGIEDDTGASVIVSKKGDPVLVTIRGNERSVADASDWVRKIIAESYQSGSRPQDRDAGRDNYGDGTPGDRIVETIKCPMADVGRILGHGGDLLRKLERQTRTRVDIDQTRDPCIVRIAGHREDVNHAYDKLRFAIEEWNQAQPGEETLQITCPQHAVGSVIGKGGSTVIRIMKDTGTRIIVPRHSDPCVIKIFGSKEGAEHAHSRVMQIIDREQERAGGREGGREADAFEEISCPRSAIYSIIGPQGTVVRGIENDTRTRVDIDKQSDPAVICIRGSREGVAKAREIVGDLIAESQQGGSTPRGREARRDDHGAGTSGAYGDAGRDAFEEISCPRSAVKSIVGENGKVVKQIEFDSRARIDISKNRDPAVISISGAREDVDHACEIVRNLIAEAESHQGQGAGTPGADGDRQAEGMRIDCPRSEVHRIIGPQGTVVRKIESTTRTKIDVARYGDPAVITIRGSHGNREGVAKACETVRNLLAEREERVDCPYSILHHVTGPNRGTQKDIENETNAKINVDTRSDPCIIFIRGSKESVDAASAIVKKLVDQNKEVTLKVECPFDFLRMVMTDRRVERATDVKIRVDKEFDPCFIFIEGDQESADEARQVIQGIIGEASKNVAVECPLYFILCMKTNQPYYTAKVRRIQDKTDTTIRTSFRQTGDPGKVVIFGGTERTREDAVGLFNEMVKRHCDNRKTIKCPKGKAVIAAIIGRGGSEIQRIRSASQAIVFVDDDQDPCVVEILSEYKENVGKAHAMVTQIIDMASPKEQVREVVTCNKSAVKFLVGHKGHKLQKIEEKTQTTIAVRQDLSPCEIRISGGQQGVHHACNTVRSVIKQIQERQERDRGGGEDLRLSMGSGSGSKRRSAEALASSSAQEQAKAAPGEVQRQKKSRTDPPKPVVGEGASTMAVDAPAPAPQGQEQQQREENPKVSEIEKKEQRMKRFGTT